MRADRAGSAKRPGHASRTEHADRTGQADGVAPANPDERDAQAAARAVAQAADQAADQTVDRAIDQAVAAFLLACRLDVEARKPGNVSIASPGHGMTASQFIASAAAASAALFRRGAPVGERILDAVQRSQAAAGCNTNLGIILLVAPLAAALEALDWPPSQAAWQERLEQTLAGLDLDDTRAAYQAIAAANPGGLGDAPEQSVHAAPSVALRPAMALAAGRDSIARQYANGFQDIFATGLGALRAASDMPAPTPPPALALAVFLAFLAGWPDSHIVRKHGVTLAHSVTQEARLWLAGQRGSHPGTAASVESEAARLAAWDMRLKSVAINPGTSADLCVATLFVAACIDPSRFAA
jgi:triphosphoribosyl-dephospho-CoA synthase